MKVLVTGANGFIGRGVVKCLNKKGINVIATGRRTDKILQNVKKVDCDLFSIEDPYNFFEKPDILLHLAWEDGFNHNSDAHLNNLYNHYNFIYKMLASGIKHIAVLGSVHEIGFYEGSVDENTKCEPQSFYGIAKNTLRMSTYLLAKKYNAIWQWLRGYYIVPIDMYGNSIFCKIIQAVNDGKKEFPFTMGLNQFDFIDYDIFCDYVTETICQIQISGIINICSGRPEKLSDRVEKFIKDNNFNIRLKYGAFQDRPYDSKAIWGDDNKIKLIMKRNS